MATVNWLFQTFFKQTNQQKIEAHTSLEQLEGELMMTDLVFFGGVVFILN